MSFVTTDFGIGDLKRILIMAGDRDRLSQLHLSPEERNYADAMVMLARVYLHEQENSNRTYRYRPEIEEYELIAGSEIGKQRQAEIIIMLKAKFPNYRFP